jgi:hypothetical protein
MPEEPDISLDKLLDQVRMFLGDEIDFANTDTETTLAKVRLLSAAAVYFNILAVEQFGGRAGAPRAPGLVEQVVGAAFQTYEGIDPLWLG